MFVKDDKVDDDITDDISILLKKVWRINTWNKEKHDLIDAIEKLAVQSGYKKFTGDYRTYNLQYKGEHCLYDVPSDKRWALSRFRNKRVRLI